MAQSQEPPTCDDLSLAWLLVSPTVSADVEQDVKGSLAQCPASRLLSGQPSSRRWRELYAMQIREMKDAFEDLVKLATKGAKIVSDQRNYTNNLEGYKRDREESALLDAWKHGTWTDKNFADRLYKPLKEYASLAQRALESQLRLACVQEAWRDAAGDVCPMAIGRDCQALLRHTETNSIQYVFDVAGRSGSVCLQKKCSEALSELETYQERGRNCAEKQSNALNACRLAEEVGALRDGSLAVPNGVQGAVDLSGRVCRADIPQMVEFRRGRPTDTASKLLREKHRPTSEIANPRPEDETRKVWHSYGLWRAAQRIASERNPSPGWVSKDGPPDNFPTVNFSRKISDYAGRTFSSLKGLVGADDGRVSGPPASTLLALPSVKVVLSVLVPSLTEKQVSLNKKLSTEFARRIIWDSYGHDAGGLVPQEKRGPDKLSTAEEQISKDTKSSGSTSLFRTAWDAYNNFQRARSDVSNNPGAGPLNLAFSLYTNFVDKEKQHEIVRKVLSEVIYNTWNAPGETARTEKETEEGISAYCEKVPTVPLAIAHPFLTLIPRLEQRIADRDQARKQEKTSATLHLLTKSMNNKLKLEETNNMQKAGDLASMALLAGGNGNNESLAAMIDTVTRTGKRPEQLDPKLKGAHHGAAVKDGHGDWVKDPKKIPKEVLNGIFAVEEAKWKPVIFSALTRSMFLITSKCINGKDEESMKTSFERFFGQEVLDKNESLKKFVEQASLDRPTDVVKMHNYVALAVKFGEDGSSSLVYHAYAYSMAALHFAFVRGALNRSPNDGTRDTSLLKKKEDTTLGEVCKKAAGELFLVNHSLELMSTVKLKELFELFAAGYPEKTAVSEEQLIDGTVGLFEKYPIEDALTFLGKALWDLGKSNGAVISSPRIDGDFSSVLTYTAEQLAAFGCMTAGWGLQRLAVDECATEYAILTDRKGIIRTLAESIIKNARNQQLASMGENTEDTEGNSLKRIWDSAPGHVKVAAGVTGGAAALAAAALGVKVVRELSKVMSGKGGAETAQMVGDLAQVASSPTPLTDAAAVLTRESQLPSTDKEQLAQLIERQERTLHSPQRPLTHGQAPANYYAHAHPPYHMMHPPYPYSLPAAYPQVGGMHPHPYSLLTAYPQVEGMHPHPYSWPHTIHPVLGTPLGGGGSSWVSAGDGSRASSERGTADAWRWLCTGTCTGTRTGTCTATAGRHDRKSIEMGSTGTKVWHS